VYNIHAMSYQTAQEFDFVEFFDQEHMDSMIAFFLSDRKTVLNILQKLMHIDTFRAYCAHTLNNPQLQKHDDPDVRQAFQNFVETKTIFSGEITQLRAPPRPDTRDAHEHSLNKIEFDSIRQNITHGSNVITTLPIIHSLVLNYLKDLKTYFEGLEGNYKEIGRAYEIGSFLEFFDIKAFAMELAPVLIHGLPDNKQDGKALSSEDWVQGIKHLFDPNMDTFRTTHGLCPFSQIIRHVFATNLGWDEDGNVVALPDTKGGAFPVFLVKWQDAQQTQNHALTGEHPSVDRT
jgi:hypothetical protein